MTRKAPGSGHVRTRTLRDGSVRYDVLVWKNGKQHTLKGGLKSLDDANAYLAAHYVERANEGLPIPHSSDETGFTTVRQLGVLYLAAIDKRKRKTAGRRWRARIEHAEFIDWPLTQLSEMAVRRWIDTMARTEIQVGKAKGKRPERGTLGPALSVLRSALKFAVIEGLIDRNVAKNVTISESTMAAPKGTPAGEGFDYLHEDEVRRILEAPKLPERQRTAFTLLAFTGARPKDLYRLTWDKVDVSGATIRYLSHKRDRHYVAHLLPQALAVLRSWWIRSGRPSSGLVFVGPKGKPHADGYDWGWADTRGRKHHYWTVGYERRHSKNEEIQVVPGWRTKIGIRRNVPCYSLRHTCASHLLLGTKLFTGGRRFSPPEVASHLGHADLSTVRRYCVALGIMSLGAVEDSRELLSSQRELEKQGAR